MLYAQVNNWFINTRARRWRPMVEDLYSDMQEADETSGAKNSQATPSTGNALESVDEMSQGAVQEDSGG